MQPDIRNIAGAILVLVALAGFSSGCEDPIVTGADLVVDADAAEPGDGLPNDNLALDIPGDDDTHSSDVHPADTPPTDTPQLDTPADTPPTDLPPMDNGPDSDATCEPSPPQVENCIDASGFQCGFMAQCADGTVTADWHHHVFCGEREDIIPYDCTMTCPLGCLVEGDLMIWPQDGPALFDEACVRCLEPDDCEGLDHPACEGAWDCTDGHCEWLCDTAEQALPTDQTDCLPPPESFAEPPPEGLLVLVPGPGSLEIRHQNFMTNCCRNMEITVRMNGLMIQAFERTIQPYAPCFCECRFDLSATLEDLPPGDYDVTLTDADEPTRILTGQATVG
jgi:hypothetical protein